MVCDFVCIGSCFVGFLVAANGQCCAACSGASDTGLNITYSSTADVYHGVVLSLVPKVKMISCSVEYSMVDGLTDVWVADVSTIPTLDLSAIVEDSGVIEASVPVILVTCDVINGSDASVEAYCVIGAMADAALGKDEVCSMHSVAWCRPGRLVGCTSATDTGGGLSEPVTGLDEEFDAVTLPLSGVGWAMVDSCLDLFEVDVTCEACCWV